MTSRVMRLERHHLDFLSAHPLTWAGTLDSLENKWRDPCLAYLELNYGYLLTNQ